MPNELTAPARRGRLNMDANFRLRCKGGWKNDLLVFARERGIDAADVVRMSTSYVIETARTNPGILTHLHA